MPTLTLILPSMVIAVNTRSLLKDQLEGIGYFVQEIFCRLAKLHPEHQFFFLLDRPYDPPVAYPSNVTWKVLGPPARHPILWKLWYDVRVPLFLKKIKADVFVSPDGFASLTTGVPQCLVVHDLGFLHQPEAYRRSHLHFLSLFTPRFIRKAHSVATVSQFSKADLVAQYGTPPDKIDVVYSAAKPLFRPLSGEEKEATRNRYTEGREYFLYTGALQPRKNLVNLLKAFSVFKKRQKSNWKMVLAGRLAWRNEELLNLLKTYKYRDDVVLTGYLPEKELVQLTGAAYALVYPSFFEGFGVPVLEGMKCGVPPLTSQSTAMQEIGEDAALYFDPADPASIADKLMLIYKDESLRSRLIQRGLSLSEGYTWERSAHLLWQCIEKAIPS